MGCFSNIKLLILGLLCLSLTAFANPEPLPFNQAFQFSAMANDYQTVILKWTIKPSYYLYHDKFRIRAMNPGKMKLAPPVLPDNFIQKKIAALGTFNIYKNSMYIIQPILNSNSQHITLQVHYQGCSEQGFCYPPANRVVSINLSGNYMQPVSAIAIDLPPIHLNNLANKLNPQDKITRMLSTDHWWGIMLGFFIFGLLIAFTPCVLPMIPILSSIIVGRGKTSHTQSFLLSLAYVLGVAITYAAAGIIFGYIGSSVQAAFQQPWLIILFTLVFIAMSLSLFGLYDIQLPSALRKKLMHASEHQKRGSYLGVALMGVLSTLVLSPCVTPPLVGVLAYISQTGNASIGGLALFSMGIGSGLPLLLIGAFGPKLIPHTGHWMIIIKNFMGLLMLGVAIWMLARILPTNITMILWALLAIGSGITLGALSSSNNIKQHIKKAIALLVFIYGILLAASVFMGNTNPLDPITDFQYNRHTSNALTFTTVKSIDDAYTQLNLPKNKNKPVMLDFYANWCIACKELDQFTFNKPAVKRALRDYVLLRADVTSDDSAAKKLQQHFGVIAPPTIVLLDKNHTVRPNAKIIGFVSATTLLKQLN